MGDSPALFKKPTLQKTSIKRATNRPVTVSNAGEIASSAYESNKEKQDKKAAEHGYYVDRNLSKGNTHVWRGEGKKTVIVHRGSKTASDWLDDGLIALGFGKHTHRYKNAERVTNRVREADRGQEAVHVGHSLGGYLAEHAGRRAEVYTYNKHSIGKTGSVVNNNQTDIRTPGDLASLPGFFKKGEKSHKKVIVGLRGIFNPFSVNTLLNPLYAHKTVRTSVVPELAGIFANNYLK